MERELRYLGEALHQPKRPFVAVLGGAKISGKIDLIEALLPKVDEILLGGAMACTFFKAMGLETGNSLVEPDRLDLARELMKKAGNKLVLPEGGVIARELSPDAETRVVASRRHPARLGRLRHRSRHGEAVRHQHREGGHGGMERPDGRVRDPAVRPRHSCGGAVHGPGNREWGSDGDRRR